MSETPLTDEIVSRRLMPTELIGHARSLERRIATLEREKAVVVKLCQNILNEQHRRTTYEFAESVLAALSK